MTQLTERLYTPHDLPALRRLWAKVYEPDTVERREQVFRWVTERNPAAPGGAPRHLILQGEAMVGSLGTLPVSFRLGSETVAMHFSHDLLVDPEARGLGLGKMLVRSVAAAAPGPAGGLWMTDPCYKLHQRAGWAPVTPFHAQGLALRPAALLRRRLGTVAAGLGPILGGWQSLSGARRIRERLPVREIETFDEGVDRLGDDALLDLGFAAERRARFLNWKYAGLPWLRYRRFLAGEADRPRGYAITRLQQRPDGHANGLMVDFLARPDDEAAFTTLVAASARALREEGAEVLYVLATRQVFRDQLRRLGFRTAPKEYTFVIHGHEALAGHGDPTESGFWHLTFGDSDGDMWSGAQSWKTGREQAAPKAPRPAPE